MIEKRWDGLNKSLSKAAFNDVLYVLRQERSLLLPHLNKEL